MKTTQHNKEKTLEYSDGLVRWLAGGERGSSSNTIVQVLTGLPSFGNWSPAYPLDVSDFRRCLLLLEACPELVLRFSMMAEVSEIWKRFVERWDAIKVTLEKEAPDWRKNKGYTPRTSALIHEIWEKKQR